jgi:Protein of unknown function (DUF3352)
MKRRSFFSIIAVGAGALVLAGIVGFASLLGSSPLNLLRGSPTPAATMFVSQQAAVMASLLVNPDRLEALMQVLTPQNQRRPARAEFAQFRSGLLAATGLDYEQDIQPWVGDEITLALPTLDVDRDAGNGGQRGYLLAMTTENADRAREFLRLFWQRRTPGQTLQIEPYKGTQIIYGTVPDPQLNPESDPKSDPKSDPESKPKSEPTGLIAPPLTLASAVVGNQFVLFANSPKVLRDAINNAQAVDLNLSQAPQYQKALAALPAQRLGLVYLNLPEISALGGREIGFDQLRDGSYAGLALGLNLNKGLIADSALVPTGPVSAQPAALTRPAALGYLPALPLAAAGSQLPQLWADLQQGLAPYPVAAQLVQSPIKAWETRWGLDLEDDILSWAQGDYGMGLLPQVDEKAGGKAGSKFAGQSVGKPGSDWIMVANRATSPKAAAAIAHLDQRAQAQGLTVGTMPIGQQQVTAWTQLTPTAGKPVKADVAGSIAALHTSLGSYEVFASSVRAMTAVVQGQAAKGSPIGLAKSPAFGAAIAPFRSPNHGYLYLDWPQARPILTQALPATRTLEIALQPLFERLQSLTATSYGSTATGVQTGGLFLRTGA